MEMTLFLFLSNLIAIQLVSMAFLNARKSYYILFIYSFEQRILSAGKYNESIFVIQLQFFKDLQTKGIIFWPHLIG